MEGHRGRARGRAVAGGQEEGGDAGMVEESPRSSSGGSSDGNGAARARGERAPPGGLEPYGRRGERPPGGRLPEFLRTRTEGFFKRGSSGESKSLVANYFQLQVRKGYDCMVHAVAFEPEEDSVGKRKKVLMVNAGMINEGAFVFDGTQLYATQPVNLEFNAVLPAKGKNLEREYRVRIHCVRALDSMEPAMTQFLNVLVKRALTKINLIQLGQHVYDKGAVQPFQNWRVQVWPGFATSIRQMEYDFQLNVDLVFKVIRMDTVFDLMSDIRNKDGRPDVFRPECERLINGCVVVTTYNNKMYKIDRIDWVKLASHTFPRNRMGQQEEITFVDYYRQVYGVEIRRPNQPLLISKPTKRDLRRGDDKEKAFIPELCVIAGLSEDMRSNFNMMRDLGRVLHQAPQERMANTVQLMKRLQDPEVANELLRWGMRFTVEPTEVEGRVLPKEDIAFGRGEIGRGNDQNDWSQSFRNCPMLITKPFRQWAMVFARKDADNIENLITTINRVAGPLGFRLPQPDKMVITDGNRRGFEEGIGRIVEKYQGKLDMIVCILPTNKLETYAAIKKMCSLRFGIPSQCFLARNMTSKGLMSICTKLVIQMNAKVGGEPWGLKCPLKDIMVIGFDVHHAKGHKSYGAMCATTNINLARYFSTILEMDSGMEMAAEMGSALERCLKAFYRENNQNLPNRIMMYRDGVGQGQLEYVYRSELDQIKRMIKAIYDRFNRAMPKLTLTVVTKRINTRLFLRTARTQVTNPLPGTVVDDRITCPERYDFYMVSQVARQGTVSPTAYHVLYDESGLDADKMQRFTYKLCHGYFNWSGTVAVPAPCQYAHKLAFLTGTALMEEAHATLLGNLHYL